MIRFQGRQLWKVVFFFLLKGVYFKRKEFAPKWSKFFPFNVDPFSEGDWRAGKQTGCYKNCRPCKMAEILPSVIILKSKLWCLDEIKIESIKIFGKQQASVNR